MIKSVSFCGVSSVKGLSPRRSIALISILDDDERFERPPLYGFAKILSQDHVDFSEEKSKLPLESVDDATGLLANGASPVEGHRVFCARDAIEIVEFVEDCIADDRTLELIIHCYAGVSRSAAVAKFVCEHYGLALSTNRDISDANPRVGRLLKKVFDMRPRDNALDQRKECSRRMMPAVGSKSKPNFP